jgi:hypothetical protein
MAKFYAYKPDSKGKEPIGSIHRTLFELKTVDGAKNRAKKRLGSGYKLYKYTNFYDDKTFKIVK